MTRRLQIRRGTSANNNIFTGMPGEVTFDTDTKTLRVHDGKTLGGFELARMDGKYTDDKVSFDINTVPDEFWQDVLNRFIGDKIIFSVSPLKNLGNFNGVSYFYDTKLPIKFATAELVCQTPQAGYSIGDVVAAFGVAGHTNPLPVITNDTQNPFGRSVSLYIDYGNMWVSHKDTGVTTPINTNRWKIQFKIWQ